MGLALEPKVAAILAVELQNDMVHESNVGKRGLGGALAEAVHRRGVLARTASLLDAARGAGVPVFYVNVENKPGFPRPKARIYEIAGKRGPVLVEGTWGAETHEAVRPRPEDFVLRRTCSMDGSYGSGLYAMLRHLRREQLVILGVSTTLAVEGIVRASLNRGYEMFVVEDCCAGVPQEWHDWSIANTLPLFATVTSAADVVAALSAPRS
ncbi:MAG TPA: cysteine hydrolase [Candidatus Binatia bacterium]|nr:cysteine hydrolase [Candidatus Binatia bacterium]